jgi:DNA polymerase III subunit epsilon
LRPSVDDVPAESHFTDKTVVFTGTLSCGLTRAQAAQLVVDAGGMTTDSMSKKVDYLVLGLQDARKVKDGKHSGKMLKAAELQRAGSQIEFLSEDDFLRMLPA